MQEKRASKILGEEKTARMLGSVEGEFRSKKKEKQRKRKNEGKPKRKKEARCYLPPAI